MLMTHRISASCTAWSENITLKLKLLYSSCTVMLSGSFFHLCCKCILIVSFLSQFFISTLLTLNVELLYSTVASFALPDLGFVLHQLSLFDVKVILKLSEILRRVWPCA